jgi:Protein of unknown function (DUF1688)
LQAAADELLSSEAVRYRAHELLEACLAGRLKHFEADLTLLDPAADYTAAVIRENYPDLRVPFHARWRHFKAGGRDLWKKIEAETDWPGIAARTRSAFDLAIVSVLLDAGAGSDWTFYDAATGATFSRSEGLAVATLRMFQAGLFSSDPESPLQADAGCLAGISVESLARGFQAGAQNPLAGLEGRAELISRLGHCVLRHEDLFARSGSARPGGLYDHLVAVHGGSLPAPAILRALLLHLAPIWPGRLQLASRPLGDTWRHPAIKRDDPSSGLVPFHKLSQWLSYSLIEPLRDAGVDVTDIDGLTGLAEYRNGGLFIDLGVLRLRDSEQAALPHRMESELVVEWRALTVALLDLIAPLVRERLGVSAGAFPLACVLEGGTWSAGRKIAKEKRPRGEPPLTIVSDGTVF